MAFLDGGAMFLQVRGKSLRSAELLTLCDAVVRLAHPSLGTVGANLTSYPVTVTGPSGKVLGTTTESPTAGSGTATLLVRLRTLGEGAGVSRLHVSGEYAASDPDTVDSDSLMGRMVTLHVAQLRRG